MLSAFNGAGGQNYTSTQFTRTALNPITSGTAPFTGTFIPQGGSMDDFAGEMADGTWIVTVVDTSCANGGTGSGGNWTPGWFNGSAGGGAFAFGAAHDDDQTYEMDYGTQTYILCPGGSVDIMSYYIALGLGDVFTATDQSTGDQPANPYAVTQAGDYIVQHVELGQYSSGYYHGIANVIDGAGIDLGPDQVVDQCGTAIPVALPDLFDLSGLTAAWSLNGQPITAAEAANATDPGVYQLVVGANSGCPSTASVTLNIHPDPALHAVSSAAVPGCRRDCRYHGLCENRRSRDGHELEARSRSR